MPSPAAAADLHGPAYIFGREQNLVGEGSIDRTIGRSRQAGGRQLGGPIVRHRKAFFFAELDFGRKSTPSGYSDSMGVPRPTGVTRPRFSGIRRYRESKYRYDPGISNEFIRRTNNDKVFVRTDFNLPGVTPHGTPQLREGANDAAPGRIAY